MPIWPALPARATYQDQVIMVRPATDGQLEPWSISHYLNRIKNQASRDSYKQATGLIELAEPLETEMG